MISIYNRHFDLSQPIDLSIELHSGFGQVNAFHAPPFRVHPVKEGEFVGSTKLGGVVNFMNFQCNPHGNGTHTECVGHISKEDFYVNKCLKDQFVMAELISVYPSLYENGDRVIERRHIEAMVTQDQHFKALIIRTLSNDPEKKERNYSGTNPVYLAPEAMEYVVTMGFEHLLVDFPSVDREEDGGKLACHKIFWNYPEDPQIHRTITELIFVPNEVKDGAYLLELQIANIRLDAVPSRPILYRELV
jgi:kynurenine formamidase